MTKKILFHLGLCLALSTAQIHSAVAADWLAEINKIKQQAEQTIQNVQQKVAPIQKTNLSPAEISRGLKEALTVGATNSTAIAAQAGGFLNQPRIKIPLPPELAKIEGALRKIGLGQHVDQFVVTLNQGAEKSAKQALPIFKNAISAMTIDDAVGILQGKNTAATQYLQQRTQAQLHDSFKPVMVNALASTKATSYYDFLVKRYNQIPFVSPVKNDLSSYATDRALNGVFVLLGDEEAKIRDNPSARVTEILQQVFARPAP